jgi:hypothetical protein
MRLPAAVLIVVFVSAAASAQSVTRTFPVASAGEVVATLVIGCERCDWSRRGREAVLLELQVDGAYSQHVATVRGVTPQPYEVLLGRLGAGTHTLTIRRDDVRSAREAGAATISDVHFRVVAESEADHDWLSHAPVLRARPGTVDRFSDLPLLMYAERNVSSGEGPAPYQAQYTVIFSNEDGGTPADRLMATWGRTTDIEFVFGITAADRREVIQAEGHSWIDFTGARFGGHPELWVATENNMVAASGAADAIRFAPAPALVALGAVSRETVMDRHPWTYRVTSDEARREGRIDDSAAAGTGRMPDPRRYVVVEACADVSGGALSIEVGMRSDRGIVWYSTDRGYPAFRIGRSGCFRAAAPLAASVDPGSIAGVRVHAFRRASGESGSVRALRVTLTRVNQLLMLDRNFLPVHRAIGWSGTLDVPLDREAVPVPWTVR